MEKVQVAENMDKLYPVDVRAIKRPSQPFFPLFCFLKQSDSKAAKGAS